MLSQVCAANSVALSYKPVLKPADRLFMNLVMKLARTKEVAPIPLEERSRVELLELLVTCRTTLQEYELLVAVYD